MAYYWKKESTLFLLDKAGILKMIKLCIILLNLSLA